MPKIIDTFSAHSLKILDKNPKEFMDKFVYHLSLYKKDERTDLGKKFHSLICAYIKNFDVSKMIMELSEKEREIYLNFIDKLKDEKSFFIETEYPFLIKEELNNENYYLTGRFDAIYKKDSEYIIYDWKTLNLPKNPKDDLQSIVYIYALSKIYNTKNIKMRYISLEKLDFIDVFYDENFDYKNRIDEIVEKYKNFTSLQDLSAHF